MLNGSVVHEIRNIRNYNFAVVWTKVLDVESCIVAVQRTQERCTIRAAITRLQAQVNPWGDFAVLNQ